MATSSGAMAHRTREQNPGRVHGRESGIQQAEIGQPADCAVTGMSARIAHVQMHRIAFVPQWWRTVRALHQLDTTA